MAEWVYEARTRAGEVQTGIIEADSKEAVQSRLRSRQLNPVKIKKKGRELKLSFGTGVTPKELVVFVRQFATMIDAGLPLVQCLDILSARGENKALNAILKDVKEYVEQGGTFSEGLGRHPKLFDELFVNLVRAGEMGGILDTILNRLAGYIEKRVKLARQVRGAMVYPVAIFLVAVLVGCTSSKPKKPRTWSGWYKQCLNDAPSCKATGVICKARLAVHVTRYCTHEKFWRSTGSGK